MTSLAKQLQKLAIPGQPSVRQVQSKKRTSLLFEAQDAADISVDTVYALGLNGLEELISINETFTEFESTLFDESCKEFERTVQMSEVLNDVDSKLEVFLRRLSPYFMLKPSQKCLEWLIHVFRVNFFNIDALMECVLPYYETNLFARVVQLLPLKDKTSKWHWLRPVKKSGSPLSKLTLTQHCLSEQQFLVFICEMVPSSIRANQHSSVGASCGVISLYTSTVLAVLERANPITEELVLRLVPYIGKGLKSKNMDYCASSYMVVSQLAVMVNMEEKFSRSMMELASKSLCEPLLKEGLSCLAILCQTQKLHKLSNKTLFHLLNPPSLVPSLSSLCHTHNFTPILSALLSSLLDAHLSQLCGDKGDNDRGEAIFTLLEKLLDEIVLEEDTAYSLVRQLLEGVVYMCEEVFVKEDKKWKKFKEKLRSAVCPLIQSLDAKYPLMMDKALETIISTICAKPNNADDITDSTPTDCGSDDEDSHEDGHDENSIEIDNKVKFLHEFISFSLPKSRHQVLVDIGSTLVLSVHHPNPSVRASAISHLGKTLKSRNKDVSCSGPDGDFISSSLMSRLADDDPAVALAVLELGSKVLLKRLPTPEFITSLTALLSKKKLFRASSKLQSCALKSLSILMSKPLLEVAPEAMDHVIISGIPLLYVGRNGNEFSGRVLEVMEGSFLAKSHPVLGMLSTVSGGDVWMEGCDRKNRRDEVKLSSASAAMFSHLGERISQLESRRFKEMLSKLVSVACSTPTDQYQYFSLMAVAGSTLKTTPPTEVDTQHQETFQLLVHIRQHHRILERGVDRERNSSDGLAAVFLPLVEKHDDKDLSHQLLLLWLLEGVCAHLIVPEVLSANMWLNVTQTLCHEHLYFHVILCLFSVLTVLVDLRLDGKGQGVTKYSKLMIQNVIQRHFFKRGSLLRFLAMIWTTPFGVELGPFFEGDLMNPTLQASSLSIACAFLKSLDVQAAVALTGNQCPVIPSLLVPLTSPHRLIRDRALDCLTTLQETCSPTYPVPDNTSTLNATDHTRTSIPPILQLVHGITRFKLEISLDSSQINHILPKLFADTSSLDCPLPVRKSQRLANQDGVAASSSSGGWLECVVMHIVSLGMPPYIQSQLLRVLDRVDHVAKLLLSLPLISSLMEEVVMRESAMETNTSSQVSGLSKHKAKTLQLFIKCFTPRVASAFSSHPELFQTFIKLLKLEIPCSSEVPSPQMLALNQINSDFFAGLEDAKLQQSILQALVEVILETNDSQVTVFIKELVAKLPLSNDLVAGELNREIVKLGEKMMGLHTPKKKRSAKLGVENNAVLQSMEGGMSLPWRRVTLVLELIEHVCHLVSGSHHLVPLLFNLLSQCLELEDSQRFEMEYTQQLLLSCLLDITGHLTSNGENINDYLSESQFNVETVVQCIRLSSNPQTHHHALLLLSSAATIFPVSVLHNIMPIFTFMGANVLHHDDLYSFQVITKTIDTVIPPLIQSGSVIPTTITRSVTSKRGTQGFNHKPKTTTVEGVVTEIIRIFVDAVPHIPEHRKLPLFTHLLKTVGSQDYLHVALGLLVEKQVVQDTARDGVNQTPLVGEARIDAGFIVSVSQQFPPNVQIMAAFKLSQYMTQLPEEKPSTAFKLRRLPASQSALFNIAGHTDEQLQQFKASTLSSLVFLLSHKEFVLKVSTLEVGDIEDDTIKLLQCILRYISYLHKSQNVMDSKTGGKSKETLLQKSYLVVEKVTLLLSFGSFLEVISQLVGVVSGEGTARPTDVQDKALKLLVSKLEDKKSLFPKGHESSIFNLIDVLMGVACESSTPLSSRQTALNSIKMIVEQLTGNHSKKLAKVMKSAIQLLSTSGLPVPMRSSCLLCVAQLSLSLNLYLIPLLPSLLPQVLSQLGSETHQKSRQIQLQLHATIALTSIIKILPNFLSSFISEIILKLCFPGVVGCKDREFTELEREAASARHEVSMAIPIRNLLPAYLKCYDDIIPHGKDSVLALLSMLSATITRLSREDCKNHGNLLLEIFLKCLDYRTHETKDMNSLSDIEAVEELCLDAFNALVIKLSEVQFRPIFLKILDWTINPHSPRERLITFYHLADRVADKLKGLFLLFASNIISNVVSLLDSNHIQKQESLFFDIKEKENDELPLKSSSLLLRYIMQCLTKCFLHDKTGFLTKERFDSLLLPLVDQVTNTIGGTEEYTSRVEIHLAGCLAYFGVAAGKESLWKSLNNQLLLKTRHKNSQVRLGTLKVLRELYVKLGEEFMLLLPETIPFLSELMEDDSEEVEILTQELITTIEDIIGESIHQYF